MNWTISRALNVTSVGSVYTERENGGQREKGKFTRQSKRYFIVAVSKDQKWQTKPKEYSSG